MKLGPSGRAADTLSLWAFSLVSNPSFLKFNREWFHLLAILKLVRPFCCWDLSPGQVKAERSGRSCPSYFCCPCSKIPYQSKWRKARFLLSHWSGAQSIRVPESWRLITWHPPSCVVALSSLLPVFSAQDPVSRDGSTYI